jgi:hypothetical protein
MKKRVLNLIIAVFLALSVFPFVATTTGAANLTAMSDTMSRLQVSPVKSNHTIVFTTPSGVAALGKIKITFSANFASGLNSVAFGDMDLLDNGSDLTLAGTCATTTWGAAVSVRTITFTSCTGTIVAGHTVTIKIGTNATGGSNQITNPSGSGSNIISLEVTDASDVDIDTGKVAVPIMTADQVTVSATVDPSITSTLSTTTCALGTLTSTSTGFCSYSNTVDTNAASGYTATIISTDTNGRLCSPSPGTCTNNIPVEDGDHQVTQNKSEYGVGTSKTGQTIVHYTTCANNNNQPADALSDTTAQQYASATGPVSSDATTLCHAATIAGSQAAGSYSHSVTHITTGHF